MCSRLAVLFLLLLFRDGEKGTSWRSFACSTLLRYGKDSCIPNRIKESQLRSELLSVLQTQALVFADRQKSLETTVNPNESETAELRAVQSELDRNGNFLKGLYESLISGDIDESEYREMKQAYEKKIAVLMEQATRLKTVLRNRKSQDAARNEASENFCAAIGLTELTAEIIDALVEKVTVFENKRIEVKFKFAENIETEGV